MRRGFFRWLRRLALATSVLFVALVIFVTLTPQGKTTARTIRFVATVLEFPVNIPSVFGSDPVREEVMYPQSSGTGVADVYRVHGGGRKAAVLIFLGANAAGRDDEDVVRLGNALARAGFVAMFHWSPTMALQHNIDPNEIENLVWGYEYLRDQDYVDPEKVGLAGFCVGASFALIAATDQRIRDDVAFVNDFGGYYNARDMLLQISSRSRFYLDDADPWDPDSLTKKVFANELIEAIDDPFEKGLLTRAFIDNQEVSSEKVDGLSREASAAYRLLEGTDLEHAQALYDELPETFKLEMLRISPSRFIGDLKARVAILHDRDDDLVPSVESRRLADVLNNSGHDYRYTEVLAFEHVRPTSGSGIIGLFREGFNLFRHMYGIIRVAS